MKLLIVRFSSIGDIVLTTPLLRCIKNQLPQAVLHYLTKQNFLHVIQSNPHVDKFYTINSSVFEITPQLKNENYDYIIDLHHNLRTLKLKLVLGVTSYSFNKLNWEKMLMVQFKINKLPLTHIVDRYFETLAFLSITNDMQGLDFFIPDKDIIEIETYLPQQFHNGYHVLVVGGSYYTKQIPLHKLKQFCELSSKPLVLLGGKEDTLIAEKLNTEFKDKTFNGCGILNLNQSASIIKQAGTVITSDTGLMHIAAALKKNIISVWGNTIPEFGMGPYLPTTHSILLEVKNLSCRPCSKLGHHSCPKKHFKCMNDIVVPVF